MGMSSDHNKRTRIKQETPSIMMSKYPLPILGIKGSTCHPIKTGGKINEGSTYASDIFITIETLVI